jgi:predicted Zn-dependent peptidase
MSKTAKSERRRIFLFLAFILLPLSSVMPQTAASAASQVSEFDVNGMKVLIKRRPGMPTVAASLFFRGGTRNMNADTAGIEGFTLNVATEASKNYPRQKLRKETSSVGTVIASAASYDYSTISMASTKQSFDTSWQIFVDVVLNPTFAPYDVERVRQGVVTALRSQTDSPEGLLESTSDSLIYAGHPYAYDPAGTPEKISRFKPADLAAYHKKLLQASRMLLVIVGDVEPSLLQQRIASSFAALPRGDYNAAAPPPLKFDKPSVDVISKGVQTNYVKGTFAAPSIGDPDYYAMRAAITILQSAVFQEVRVKRNLSYAPDADLDNRVANTGSISVTSVDPNEAVGVMLDEIQKLKDGQVDDDSLGQIGGFFLTTYYLGQETNAAQAASLAQYEMMGGGWRNLLEFLDRMRAVKPSDVQAAANKYMKNLRFVVVGNPAHVNNSVFLQK